jgi:4-amino-4-deoxy-L-arabinose transferase-like glycosyltransferase
LFISTAISNDAPVTFFSTLALYFIVRRTRRGAGVPLAFPLGLALGLASVTKESALALFPLIGLALVMIYRGFCRAMFRDAAWIGLVAAAVGGWWYMRNTILFHDPLLASTHPFTGPGTLAWSQIKYNFLTMEYWNTRFGATRASPL